MAPYEQTKKGLPHFYPQRIVDVDDNHTRPLNLQTILLCIVIFFFLKINCKAIVSIYISIHSFKLLAN